MNSFELLVSNMLQHEGYWTLVGYKIPLTPEDKRAFGKHSHPRGEIDIIAYKPAVNELLAIECKSYLDSGGVKFSDAGFDKPDSYKLFTDDRKRTVVLDRLKSDLVARGFCIANPKVVLCLAVGKFKSDADKERLVRSFETRGWRLFGPDWVVGRLRAIADDGYQDDVACMVSKLIWRNMK